MQLRIASDHYEILIQFNRVDLPKTRLKWNFEVHANPKHAKFACAAKFANREHHQLIDTRKVTFISLSARSPSTSSSSSRSEQTEKSRPKQTHLARKRSPKA